MEDNVQGSRQGSRVLEMLEQCVSVPSGDCHTGYHISDGRKGIGMKDRCICEFCKGRLDPGEKCDCQRLKGRTYTRIEGAGYKPALIRPVSEYHNKKPAE